MKKTIILVADVKNWAFDNIAQYISSLLKDDYDCHIIYTADYSNYEHFLQNLDVFPKIDFIHIFYRAYLNELIEYIARKYSKVQPSYVTKFLQSAITTNVPEHLFIENPQQILAKLPAFTFVDNYYTVSKRLYDIYCNITEYPKPWGFIYDNVRIEETNLNETIQNDKLVVTWVGNSAWGEWHYGKSYDSKGFKKLIVPTFEELERLGVTVEKQLLDSQIKKRTKEEILSVLKRTDILLMGAKTEGTPLPVIEAMASGCAIICTDAGIAPEVLPLKQQEFVLERDPKAFAQAIKKLDKDRNLLEELKRQNFKAFNEIFCNDTKFKKLWSALIEDSVKRVIEENRIEEKRTLLNKLNNGMYKASIFNPQGLVKRFINNPEVKNVIKKILTVPIFRYIARELVSFYYFIESKKKSDKNIKNFLEHYKHHKESIIEEKQVLESSICVIYPQIFDGVANSTKELFKHSIALPVLTVSYFIGLSPRDIDKISLALLESDIDRIIFSSGDSIQLQLANRLNELKNVRKLDIYLLWHGSPAQWVDVKSCVTFNSWLQLYKKSKIKGIITLKQDLEYALRAYKINSYLMQNFIPNQALKKVNKSYNEEFRVGLWSAYTVWIKNLYPQLVALGMLKDRVACHTNFSFNKYDAWINEGIKLENFPEKIPHAELMYLMSNTDLTLYVTNTECSPMIALESLSLGVPCLVGPSSKLYHADEYLENMLTVNRVDCPYTIAQAIEKVIENYDGIIKRLPAFIENYNNKAVSLKSAVIKSIFEA
ncbi:MAG: family 2 glycosyl transferase [Rickettsiaceae bacterium]|jgi:glycosyltransferase involved in cell wall biosynthesis|nr:family 2 glycosyl transferase [Rickettsiaceae bacterium]